MAEPAATPGPTSAVLATVGVGGLLVAITMLADARWALLVASLIALYGALVAATHGR